MIEDESLTRLIDGGQRRARVGHLKGVELIDYFVEAAFLGVRTGRSRDVTRGDAHHEGTVREVLLVFHGWLVSFVPETYNAATKGALHMVLCSQVKESGLSQLVRVHEGDCPVSEGLASHRLQQHPLQGVEPSLPSRLHRC